MSLTEEVIDATLEPNGALRLAHPPQLPPGPVRVTIQTVGPTWPRRTLADVIREIRTSQIARGFQGLTPEELRQREAEREAENDEYDQEMEPPWSVAPARTRGRLMLYYLDASIVIYAVQAGAAEHQRAVQSIHDGQRLADGPAQSGRKKMDQVGMACPPLSCRQRRKMIDGSRYTDPSRSFVVPAGVVTYVSVRWLPVAALT